MCSEYICSVLHCFFSLMDMRRWVIFCACCTVWHIYQFSSKVCDSPRTKYCLPTWRRKTLFFPTWTHDSFSKGNTQTEGFWWIVYHRRCDVTSSSSRVQTETTGSGWSSPRRWLESGDVRRKLTDESPRSLGDAEVKGSAVALWYLKNRNRIWEIYLSQNVKVEVTEHDPQEKDSPRKVTVGYSFLDIYHVCILISILEISTPENHIIYF